MFRKKCYYCYKPIKQNESYVYERSRRYTYIHKGKKYDKKIRSYDIYWHYNCFFIGKKLINWNKGLK